MTSEVERPRLTTQLVDSGIVAILRAPSAARFVEIAEAISDAGITCVEFTLNSPGCLDALTLARQRLPAAVAVGVGTAMAPAEVSAAVDAGAEFVVAPNVDLDVIARATELNVPCYPGAWTATEVMTAWHAGAAAVKIFPASVGGPDYLRHLRAPLSDVRMVPTGGIGIGDIAGYLRAGATAVGLGGPLLGDAPTGGDLGALEQRVHAALAAVADAREGRKE